MANVGDTGIDAKTLTLTPYADVAFDDRDGRNSWRRRQAGRRLEVSAGHRSPPSSCRVRAARNRFDPQYSCMTTGRLARPVSFVGQRREGRAHRRTGPGRLEDRRGNDAHRPDVISSRRWRTAWSLLSGTSNDRARCGRVQCERASSPIGATERPLDGTQQWPTASHCVAGNNFGLPQRFRNGRSAVGCGQ